MQNDTPSPDADADAGRFYDPTDGKPLATQVRLALAELEHLADRAELIALATRIIAGLRAERDALEAQLERYRNIIITLEGELAETTSKAMLAEYLHTEVVELRAQVAKLLELNAEGRPWQITKAADA